MIRVNLAKSQSYVPEPVEKTGISINSSFLEGGNEVVYKFFTFFIFAILLYGYERYSLGEKEVAKEASKRELQAVEAEIKKFGSVTTVIEDLLKEKNKLNEQLKVIQQISQKRAFKLGAIIKVQERLPDDLWLKQMIIDKNLVIFKGYSRTPSSVDLVVKRLNDTDFITSALNKELKRVKIGTEEVQEFDIEAKVMQ